MVRDVIQPEKEEEPMDFLNVVSTRNVVHPRHDPFSRARLPYLECSPPRIVKSSILELARWEKLNVWWRYGV